MQPAQTPIPFPRNASAGSTRVIPNPKAKLLDQVREVLRVKHYSIRTEDAYLGWIKRFIFFHGKRHPREMGAPEVQAFLSHLAVEGQVAASTQNQALNAIVFLYNQVLHMELGALDELVRPRRPKRIPVVLTKEEMQRVTAAMTGTAQLMARLLYGSGLRLMECLRLRVKDVDFAANHIISATAKAIRTASPCCPPRSNQSSPSTSNVSGFCTKKIWPTATARFTCLKR